MSVELNHLAWRWRPLEALNERKILQFLFVLKVRSATVYNNHSSSRVAFSPCLTVVSTKEEGELLPNVPKKNVLSGCSLEVLILCATCGTRLSWISRTPWGSLRCSLPQIISQMRTCLEKADVGMSTRGSLKMGIWLLQRYGKKQVHGGSRSSAWRFTCWILPGTRILWCCWGIVARRIWMFWFMSTSATSLSIGIYLESIYTFWNYHWNRILYLSFSFPKRDLQLVLNFQRWNCCCSWVASAILHSHWNSERVVFSTWRMPWRSYNPSWCAAQ